MNHEILSPSWNSQILYQKYLMSWCQTGFLSSSRSLLPNISGALIYCWLTASSFLHAQGNLTSELSSLSLGMSMENLTLNLKVRVMFYLVDFLRISSLGHSISDNTEKIVLKGQREGSQIYRVFCNKRLGNKNIKSLLLIKADQRSQVNAFRAFLCLGRCKSLGSLKSFLWCAP